MQTTAGIGRLERPAEVQEGEYDLVLCGYRLPEINGLATARLIRDLVNTMVRPALIGLTGAPASLTDEEAVPGSAFDEMIAKPADLDKLTAIVQRHPDARPDATTFGKQPGRPAVAPLHPGRKGRRGAAPC